MKRWKFNPVTKNKRVVVFGEMKAGKSTFLNLITNVLCDRNYDGVLEKERNIFKIAPWECTSFSSEISLSSSGEDKLGVRGKYEVLDESVPMYVGELIKEEYSVTAFSTFLETWQKKCASYYDSEEYEIDEYDTPHEELRFNTDNKLVLKEITSLDYQLELTNLHNELNGIELFDTPGFGGSKYAEKNPDTLNRIKNAAKVILVVDITERESQPLGQLIEFINNYVQDKPKVIIVNYRQSDINGDTQSLDKERVNLIIDTFKADLTGGIEKLVFIDLQWAMKKKDGHMGIALGHPDSNILFFNNRRFTIDDLISILKLPYSVYPPMIKTILNTDNRIESSKLGETFNFSGENFFSKNPLSDGISEHSDEDILKFIQNRYDDKMDELVYANTIDSEFNPDSCKYLLQKKCKEITSNYDGLKDEVQALNKICELKCDLLFKRYKIKDGDYSPAVLSKRQEIIEMLNQGMNEKKIIGQIGKSLSTSFRELYQRYVNIWKAYLRAFDRLKFQFRLNTKMRTYMNEVNIDA